jgi:hypothetical protein
MKTIKTWTFKLEIDELDNANLTRTNDGFMLHELLGLLEAAKAELIGIMLEQVEVVPTRRVLVTHTKEGDEG